MTRITDEAVEAATSAYEVAWDCGVDDGESVWMRAALEAALPHLEGATPAIDFRGVYEAAASLQTAEDIAEVVEEYADELDMPTTIEWLELRSWFKGLLHELAARAREIGGAS